MTIRSLFLLTTLSLFLVVADDSAFAGSKARHDIQAAKSSPRPQPIAHASPTPTPCDAVQRSSSCELLVDADDKAAQLAAVHNGAKVTIRIVHQPFATCSVSGASRTPEKPDTQLATLIGALTPIAGVFTGGVNFKADLTTANSFISHAKLMLTGKGKGPHPVPTPSPSPSPTPDPEADAIKHELDIAEKAEKDLGDSLDAIRKSYATVNDTLNADLAGPFSDDSDLKGKVTHSATAIETELGNDADFASLDRVQDLLKALNRRVRAYETHLKSRPKHNYGL